MVQFRDLGGDNVEIITDESPEVITEVGLFLYKSWIEFARGQLSLGGRSIENPTGRYAASIKMRKDGKTGILIYADEKVAKHAKWISIGHAPFDMKIERFMGLSFPMHRGARVFTGYSPKVPISKKGDTGWVIPEMKPYSPAKILGELAAASLN